MAVSNCCRVPWCWVLLACALTCQACAADELLAAAALDGALGPSHALDASNEPMADSSLRTGADGQPANADEPDAGQGGDEAGAGDGEDGGQPVLGETGRLAGLTAAHNAVRARVSGMPPLAALVWSPDVAAVAQAYASQLAATCADTLDHSSEQQRRGYGENLASFASIGSGTEPVGSAARAVELWASEARCYTYGPFASGVNATCSADCQAYGGCGHYTQLVWRATERVGCGVGECARGKTRKSYWVCNYDPPGNFLGVRPY